MSSSNFKVIIVGGGPVGLTAAHTLSRANIDFVLLEMRPEIVIDSGSNLVLLPMGMRLLGQLGLLDIIDSVSSPLAKTQRMDHSGHDLGDFNLFTHLKENHGAFPRVISRHDLTKILYDSLPAEAQAKLLPKKKLADIITKPDNVIVNCADGTSYSGSILIGADGAHSLVRDCMRKLALQALPHVPTNQINEEKPFLTTYRAIWIRFPTQKGLKPGDAIETHGYHATVQTFAGEETAVIGVYERLDEPTKERVRYNKADEDAFIRRWGHLPISEHLTIQDAYKTRVGAGLINLEEGVVQNWSWDRIVLVGDAAHKFTPSTGAGCNNGMVDIVALTNELHRVAKNTCSATLDCTLSMDQITSAFKRYQNVRFDKVVADCEGAGQATAAATWQSIIHKFIDRNIMPISIVQRYFGSQAALKIAQTPVLDFVRGEEQMVGRVAWTQPTQTALLAGY